MAYKVVIMPPAKEQLDMYIGYTIRVLKISKLQRPSEMMQEEQKRNYQM